MKRTSDGLWPLDYAGSIAKRLPSVKRRPSRGVGVVSSNDLSLPLLAVEHAEELLNHLPPKSIMWRLLLTTNRSKEPATAVQAS